MFRAGDCIIELTMFSELPGRFLSQATEDLL